MPEFTDYATCRSRLLQFVAQQERSTWDCHQKFVALNGPRTRWPELLQELLDEDLVNDQRFATAFAADKLRLQHWGRNKVLQGLAQRGVRGETAHRAVEALDEGTYADVLRKLARQKLQGLGGLPLSAAQRAQWMRFLLQRGFTHNDLKRWAYPLLKGDAPED